MALRYKISAVVLFLAICAAVPGGSYLLDRYRARQATPADLYKVIHTQLDAFRSDDFSLAYSQASYGMHQKFSLDEFEKMIRKDYAEFARAQRIEFGLVQYRDRRALIEVFFIDRNESVQPCIYNLIFEGARWKVDGVVMLPRWPSGSHVEDLRA